VVELLLYIILGLERKWREMSLKTKKYINRAAKSGFRVARTKTFLTRSIMLIKYNIIIIMARCCTCYFTGGGGVLVRGKSAQRTRDGAIVYFIMH